MEGRGKKGEREGELDRGWEGEIGRKKECKKRGSVRRI